jgi:precorrin-8X/cobalt-precorrin-8 methylmutase
MRTVHPIEVESYRIMRSLVDTSSLPPLTRAVTERIVHTTADLDLAADVVTREDHLAAGRAALLAGRPVVTDVGMVAAGITRRDLLGPLVCRVADPDAAALAARAGLTRSAAGVRLAAAEVGAGAVWVVGNAPTALFELLRLAADGLVPAFVVGLPVGFVGAAEAKAALRATGLPQVSNASAKGGSPLAAAAVNALLYADLPADPEVLP